VWWSALTVLFTGTLFVLALVWRYWPEAVGAGILTVVGLVSLIVQLQVRSSRRA
jgi:H+/Cl- antiporter ClcA